ncbi:hypothetical protein [Spirillospora sp. CA-294931]|uniref:hypothetical protein n=1 Tax=Spirillospora sp. CA-294931 TaxID=3240042 RepID=UPI003D916558
MPVALSLAPTARAVSTREALRGLVEFARRRGLILVADEIWDRILYDGSGHVFVASAVLDLLCLTFGGSLRTA